MVPVLKRFLPFIMLGIFALALFSVFRQLEGYHWNDLIHGIRQMPGSRVGLALALTLVSYLVMTGYDILALRYIRHPLGPGKTAMASFLGYSFSNNIGFAMLAGASVRFRIYSAWGLSAVEITQVVLFCTVSTWLGFMGLCGAVFLFEPLALPQNLHLPFASARPLGIALLLVLLIYLSATVLARKSIHIRDWQFTLPTRSIATGQLIIALADWLLVATVLWCLWPRPAEISFAHFMAVFLIAQLGGLVSQMPGGLGVFESIVLLLAPAALSVPALLASLIVFRGVYYLAPLLVAVVLLGIEEVLRRRAFFAQVRDMAGRVWSVMFTPVLSIAVFLSGALLLVSGTLPAISPRLMLLEQFMPLSVLEISHFLGSIAGIMLMLLARGLQRRLDAGYVLTLVLLGVGMASSLFKGLDYEEALVLLIVFLVLLPSRRLFFRRTSLFSEVFSAGWIAAIATALISVTWLGLFAFRHVEYSHDLWWQFSINGDAPRFMRAEVGILALVLMFALSRLLKPAAPPALESDRQEMDIIRTIAAGSTTASSNLALLGDKRFLINSDRNAFIMYGVSGRSWVSMGDPIGPEKEWPELIWQFHRNTQRYADHTVFYEVTHNHLHLYLDLGLAALKIGEEARVPLVDFTLEGSHRKKLRYAQRKLTEQGCTFELVPAQASAKYLAELQAISDAWLMEKNTREKGFSLGFFDSAYLSQTPVALVRVQGRPVAFANVWLSAGQEEMSVDLMRHLPEAPNGMMEYLFINMLLWGHAQGFKWFNLGMVPLSGLENREAAPLWHKLGYWVALHGEHFYNFQGLRQFKQKFDPVWRPKYLACPGGLVLPRILMEIGALVSGGLKGIVLK